MNVHVKSLTSYNSSSCPDSSSLMYVPVCPLSSQLFYMSIERLYIFISSSLPPSHPPSFPILAPSCAAGSNQYRFQYDKALTKHSQQATSCHNAPQATSWHNAQQATSCHNAQQATSCHNAQQATVLAQCTASY